MEDVTKQTVANKKWQSQNKEYSNYLKARSTSRGFIRKRATSEDLEELEQLILNRRNELAQG